jgi:hypothetical protein
MGSCQVFEPIRPASRMHFDERRGADGQDRVAVSHPTKGLSLISIDAALRGEAWY